MKVWFLVHEYSESAEFPDVTLYASHRRASDALRALAIKRCEDLGGRITHHLDGAQVTALVRDYHGWVWVNDIRHLNVEFGDNGACECLRLGHQEVALPPGSFVPGEGDELDSVEPEASVSDALDLAQRHHLEQEALTGRELAELDEARADMNEDLAALLADVIDGRVTPAEAKERRDSIERSYGARLGYRCPCCTGGSIYRDDVTAYWNEDAQDWELSDTDTTPDIDLHCGECGASFKGQEAIAYD